MAAGGVGGYFGARLAAAGHEVFFIARGAHAKRSRRTASRSRASHGNVHLPNAKVTDDPAKVGPVDIVLFAVKLWDTEKAAELTRPLVGPQTRVITLQNGIDSYERVAPIVGAREHRPWRHLRRDGDRPAGRDPAGRHVPIDHLRHARRPLGRAAQSLRRTRVRPPASASLSDDIQRDRWHKFIFLSATSGATAVTRTTMGPILADPDTRALFYEHHARDAEGRSGKGRQH